MKLQYLKHYIGKCKRAWETIKRVSKVDHLVCVDYNFINWFRAIAPYIIPSYTVIPNFTRIPPLQPQKNGSTINIIFARRFFPYRGTRLFTKVSERLLIKYQNIRITIAGTGPDAEYIHNELDKYDNIHFTTYESSKSLQIHEGMDIAVVPTLGSEGTSLSLLEAMASGCAVVCTNVGGMTNIVFDGYNGLIINPDEDSLYYALEQLINHPESRALLQQNAYKTTKAAFSIEKWQERWKQVIMQK